MEENKIRQRCDIPEEDKWAVEDIYPSDEAWEAEAATIEEEKALLMTYAGHLAESGEKLFAYLSDMERVDEKLNKLAGYSMRRADEDTRVAAYQAMVGKFMGMAVGLGAATSFETPEIMAISDETMDRFYAECPKLERYRRYLTNMRRRRAHTLSAEEERLLEFLSQARNVSEMLEIESRLTEVRAELESITSQLKVYDNLVDYGTVTLRIDEVKEYTVIEEEEPSLWRRMGTGFSDSMQNLGKILEALLVFIVSCVPYLIPTVVVGAVVLLVIKLAKKRKK